MPESLSFEIGQEVSLNELGRSVYRRQRNRRGIIMRLFRASAYVHWSGRGGLKAFCVSTACLIANKSLETGTHWPC